MPQSSQIAREREYEATVISVLVANHLHNARILDAEVTPEKVGPMSIETTLDGDIPVRVTVEKKRYGPTWIEWHLWPEERGTRTSGMTVIHRLSFTNAILDPCWYERSCKRSARIARIPLPDANWGVCSSHCDNFGIETTY